MEEPLEGVGTEPGFCRVGEAKGESVVGCVNSVKFCWGTRTAEKLQTGLWQYCAAVKNMALESGCPGLNSNPSSATSQFMTLSKLFNLSSLIYKIKIIIVLRIVVVKIKVDNPHRV